MGKRGTAATQPTGPVAKRQRGKAKAEASTPAAAAAPPPPAAGPTTSATPLPAQADFNTAYFKVIQDAVNSITSNQFFEDIRTAEPLTMDPGLPEHCRGDQAPFDKEQFDLLMTNESCTYKAGCNVFYLDLFRAPNHTVPYNPGQMQKLKDHFFKDFRGCVDKIRQAFSKVSSEYGNNLNNTVTG